MVEKVPVGFQKFQPVFTPKWQLDRVCAAGLQILQLLLITATEINKCGHFTNNKHTVQYIH